MASPLIDSNDLYLYPVYSVSSPAGGIIILPPIVSIRCVGDSNPPEYCPQNNYDNRDDGNGDAGRDVEIVGDPHQEQRYPCQDNQGHYTFMFFAPFHR